MKKKGLTRIFAIVLSGALFLGMNLSAFAADGDEPTAPTPGTATVDVSGGNWIVTNDQDAVAAPTDADGAQVGVWAKVNIAGSSVYKIDIAWGAMNFSYSNTERAWDPTTHTYRDSNDGVVGWEASFVNGTNNKVTITNHSNASIKAGLTYAHALTDGHSLFNEDVAGANAVRGHFFESNADAITATGVLTNSATVVSELITDLDIAACPENAVGDTIPSDDVFFTFNGTPDPAATTNVGNTFKKVGIITVTIGNGI